MATLIDRMKQPRWLNPYEQQDSHEFFLSLINCLTSPQVIQKKHHFGFAACLDSDEPKSLMITESPLITPHPFQGLQATQLQCMECKHKVRRFSFLSKTIDFNCQNYRILLVFHCSKRFH